MSNEEQSLLEGFVVNNEDLDELEAHLAQFNIFEALGVARQELRHSDFLAFLMDPSESHGLGDAFLKRFLKRALMGADLGISAVEIDVADLNGAVVERERWHIDILVHDENNRLVCVVENKIGSGEHSGQLGRYHDIIQKEYPNSHYRHVFIYLTPEGDLPSEDVYIPFSYGTIAELVDYVRGVFSTRLGPNVQSLMEHYAIMLRRHVVSDSKIVELCQKIYREHKEALDLIFEQRPDLQAELAEVLKQLINDAKDDGMELRDAKKNHINFAYTRWSGKVDERASSEAVRKILVFRFYNFPDGLGVELLVGSGPQHIRKSLFQWAQEHRDVFSIPRRELTPGETRIFQRRILEKQDYEGHAVLEDLVESIEHGWNQFLKEDLPRINDAFSGVT